MDNKVKQDRVGRRPKAVKRIGRTICLTDREYQTLMPLIDVIRQNTDRAYKKAISLDI